MVVEMAKEIYVDETIGDKDSWFNIKRFKIGSKKIEKPEKTLDVKRVTKREYENLVKNKHGFKLLEVSKTLNGFNQLQKLLEADTNKEVDDFFSRKSWYKNRYSINFTFNFNPYNHIDRLDDIGGFFDYYHSYSNLLFVPNIRKNIKRQKDKIQIIDIDNYLNFVDEVYEYLDFKNKKPIFVPVSVRLSAKDIDRLTEHYLKKGYFNYWFDFEGHVISERSLGLIRRFFNNIDSKGYFEDIVSYFTNIRREIKSSREEEESPASDVLGSFSGANIIGVNRNIGRPMEAPPPPPLPEHKFRIFNGDTYYYDKNYDKKYQNESINNTHNSIKLLNEFTNQSNYFLNSLEIKNLLKSKKMLKEYRDGKILDLLTTK
ncbi:MAG: hypothetical protein R6U44_08840 [Archaeoglobaceae archaeon]